MKCTIPEISWHNRDPVLSIDIQPIYNEEFYRLATGGTDCHVLIWYLKIRKNGAVDVDVVSDLNRHQRAVNVVRWSPSGQYLATGDDDANIIIWNLKTDNIPLLDGETSDKETWLVHKILRGHKEDVYDICWSPNGLKLISGSIDNTAILWDLTKGLNECILTDHKGFVQGVTWDPKGQYIATLCSDRVCRIFNSTGKHVKARVHKGLLPLPESHVLFNKEVKYFHDDTFKSYFRRLTFTPDGSLLITPSGCIESEDYKGFRHTTLIFTLDCLTQPAAVLPNPKQETVAVRCCPVLFELHPEGSDPIIDLPYRMVIAVATDSDVVLYDTQQLVPFAHLQKVHYTRITDLTWSSDGLILIASSTDGYCTLNTFEPNELGVQYVKEESEAEESFLDISGCEELEKTETNKNSKGKEQVDAKTKKPNLLEQWAIRKSKEDIQKKNSAQNIAKGRNNILQEKPVVSDEGLMDVDKSCATVQKKEPTKIIPKRIVPIKIADIQKTKNIEKVCTNVVNNTEEKETLTQTSKENVEKENVIDKITKVETKSSNNEVIAIDDSSLKENASALSVDTVKSNSKVCTPKQKRKTCDNTPSRKRKMETKIITPTRKNSPLLKFLQTAENKSGSSKGNVNTNNNKSVSDNDVIEISDDEYSDKCINPKENKVNQVSTEADDSNDVCIIDNHSSVHVETTNIKVGDKTHTHNDEEDVSQSEISEKQNMEIEGTCNTFAINRNNSNEKSNTLEASTSKTTVLPAKAVTPKASRRIALVTLSSPKRKKKV